MMVAKGDPSRSSAAGAEMFLEMLLVDRGASANTREAYQRDLVDFGKFQRARGVDPAAVGDADIRAYLSDLAARDMAPRTVARRLSTLRQFFQFLASEGIRTGTPRR